jgi:hypothetical protein
MLNQITLVVEMYDGKEGGDIQRLSLSSLYTFRERLCYYVLTILLANQNAPQLLRFAAGGCALLRRSCAVTADPGCGCCGLQTAVLLCAAVYDRNKYK